MNNKKKIIILSSIIIGVMVVVLGVAYAAFTYDRVGNNSDLVLGDIYMHYNESDKIININNMMPSENYSNDYFEFTIDGKNTYDEKDIWYEIVLSSGEYTGDDPNRTIPIDSQMLRFKLVEVVDDNEVEIFNNRAYSDISNKRIWVDTIGSDDGNYSKTYRLYVRIYEYTNICAGEATENCDYYINPSDENANYDWDKLYASIKVNVRGDLEEKSIETDASCFTYEVVSIENPTVNSVMASQQVVDNELTRCVSIYTDWNYEIDEGSDAETFCRGTGTAWDGLTIQEDIDDWISSIGEERFLNNEGGQELLDASVILKEGENYIVNPVMATQEYIEPNELTRCVNYFSNNSDFTLSDGEDYTSFCQGSGTLNGNTFQTSIDNGILTDYINELAFLNIITGTDGTIKLTSYDESCGQDVVIPREIDDYSINKVLGVVHPGYYYAESIFESKGVKNIILLDNITEIGDYAFYRTVIDTIEIPDTVIRIGENAFYASKLKSVKLPNNIQTIGDWAFRENSFDKIYIPKSIKTWGYGVFRNNTITTVEFEDGVTEIADSIFFSNLLTNVEIPNSVTTIGYSAFSNNQLTSIVIPNSVTTIGFEAFSNNQLTSVTFKENSSITTIEYSAFRNNKLTSVVIPNSVTTIGYSAFSDNQLTSVTIGSGIQYIYFSPFAKSETSNPNLESITFTSKNCEEIKNIVSNEGSTKKYFPWLYSSSPYYQDGYKANIIGTDGVCSY